MVSSKTKKDKAQSSEVDVDALRARTALIIEILRKKIAESRKTENEETLDFQGSFADDIERLEKDAIKEQESGAIIKVVTKGRVINDMSKFRRGIAESRQRIRQQI